FSSRRRHTRWPRDWSSDVCSSDLSAINVCRGFVEAENDYYAKQKSYAQRFFSTEGKHDGLYWASSDPNDESPVAEEVAKAMTERSEERRVGKECRAQVSSEKDRNK